MEMGENNFTILRYVNIEKQRLAAIEWPTLACGTRSYRSGRQGRLVLSHILNNLLICCEESN
jgi:hypothetical protein